MSWFSKDIATMDDLFIHGMRDIYYAENQILEALPTMIDKASDPKLKQGFQAHLLQTKDQIRRLEKVFEMIQVQVESVNCPAIDGILDEANEVASDISNKKVLDAALIAAAQSVEHYEISRYGTLIAWAKLLGRADCANVLQQTLAEEKSTDAKLTSLAETNINLQAA
jgi:ferritin-like metal-binding protein YciE